MIYANIATEAKVVLIDRNTHKVIDWLLKTGKSNYPMALDEADHRIFVVTRRPAQLVTLDADSGATVASVPCVNTPMICTMTPGEDGFMSPEARASSA